MIRNLHILLSRKLFCYPPCVMQCCRAGAQVQVHGILSKLGIATADIHAVETPKSDARYKGSKSIFGSQGVLLVPIQLWGGK